MDLHQTHGVNLIVTLIHKKGNPNDPGNYRMIALTNVIGKTFHLILSKRTTQFLIANNLIDPTAQKAFLPGVSGCTDHNLIMDEVVKTAKTKKKTVHITYFDLAEAFGSVEHELIYKTLAINNFPYSLQEYFKRLYKTAKSKVVTKKFQ